MRLHTAPRRVSSASNTTLQFRANKQRSLTLLVPFVFFLGNGIHFSHHHSFSHFRGVPLGVDLHVIHASHTKQRNRFVASVTIGTDIFNSAGGLVGAISPVLLVCCLAFCLVEFLVVLAFDLVSPGGANSPVFVPQLPADSGDVIGGAFLAGYQTSSNDFVQRRI